MPRGLAVAVVFCSFAAAMVIGIVALVTVVVEQAHSASDRVDSYLTDEGGHTGRRPDLVPLGRRALRLHLPDRGYVVVPNVMANALRLNPLLVIFGLLAGAELYGIAGILVALPVLAASRAIWEFFSERIRLEPWGTTAGPSPSRWRSSGPPRPA